MRNTPRARRPVMALAAPAIIAIAGLLSACSPAHTGGSAAQQSPQASQSPVPQQSPVTAQTPVSQQSPASPAPTAVPSPGPGAVHLDPARFSKVTVYLHLPFDDEIKVHQQYRSPAAIARLTGMINGLPAAKQAKASCSAGDFSYRMMFTTKNGGPATTVTGSEGCPTARISVDGKPAQLLMSPAGTLSAAVRHMFRLHISHSGL